MRWGVHSVAEGQDDGAFYRSIGLESAGTSLELVKSLDIGVALSVRLHGALQAILEGLPTIHLSYERKGWGAYADLGLTEWVHDARSFDPENVGQQLDALLADPTPYWDCLDRQVPRLLGADEGLVKTAARLLEMGG
jgi:hypothetical protein